MALKKKERFVVSFREKTFQRSEKSEWLQSGNVAWPSWCIRVFIYFYLLCFLSNSWYANLGKEVESQKGDFFLPKILKCKETTKYISDYIENFPWILSRKILFNAHISASLHFLFYLVISQRGMFPVYSLCSLGIMFVCMSKPAKVAITEVITRRWNQLGLFPCEVSQVAESGPCVNLSVSQRVFFHLISKKKLLEHQTTKACKCKVQEGRKHNILPAFLSIFFPAMWLKRKLVNCIILSFYQIAVFILFLLKYMVHILFGIF